MSIKMAKSVSHEKKITSKHRAFDTTGFRKKHKYCKNKVSKQ